MTPESESLDIRHRRAVTLGLVLLSMAARLATLKGNQWLLGKDVDDYLRLAEYLSEWGTFGWYDDIPTAYRPPLYPILLAPLYWLQSHLGLAWGWRLTAIALLHLVFGAGATALTYRLARRLELKLWSVLAGALVALDPLLVHHVRLPMTETMATFLVAASLYLMVASEGRAGSWLTYAAGFVLGLGMLCRTTIWAFVLAAAVFGGWSRSSDGRRHFEWASVVLVVALLVQVPWFLRNWFAFGHVIATTTHGGYTLLLGNNDSYYDEVIRRDPFSAWPSESLTQWQNEMNLRAALAGAKNEVARDAYNYQIARQTIVARPFDFAVAVLVRMVSLWRVVPHDSEEYGTLVRLGCASFYVPELLLMLIGLCNRKAFQWPVILCLSALLSFTLVHSVYWSDLRMRAPIIPAVAILAAIGAERAWRMARGFGRDA